MLMARKNVIIAETVWQKMSKVNSASSLVCDTYGVSATCVERQCRPFMDELHLGIQGCAFDCLR
jgi:hypothetical protein